MTAALGASLIAPLWALAIGPLLWGGLHLLADVRYLVVRPRLHRRPLFWLVLGLPLLALTATADLRWGLLAVVGAMWIARGAAVAEADRRGALRGALAPSSRSGPSCPR